MTQVPAIVTDWISCILSNCLIDASSHNYLSAMLVIDVCDLHKTRGQCREFKTCVICSLLLVQVYMCAMWSCHSLVGGTHYIQTDF